MLFEGGVILVVVNWLVFCYLLDELLECFGCLGIFYVCNYCVGFGLFWCEVF